MLYDRVGCQTWLYLIVYSVIWLFKFMGKNNQKIIQFCSWLLALVSLLGLVLVNLLDIPYADDWANSLNSWSDLIPAVFHQYYNWTGRFFSLAMLYATLLMPRGIFSVLNIVVIVVSCFLVVRLGLGPLRWKESSGYATIVYLLIWWFVPAYGEVFIWQTGAVVYLWVIVTILFWLLPYRKLFFEVGTTVTCMPFLGNIVFFIFSICVGAGIENTSFCAFLMGAGVIIWRRIKGLPVPGWAWLGVFGVLLGWLFLIVAPGNYVRAGFVSSSFSAQGIVDTSKKIFQYWRSQPLSYVALLFLIHSALRWRRWQDCSDLEKSALLFFLFAIINTFGLVLSPSVVDRVHSGAFFLLACGAVAVLKDIYESGKILELLDLLGYKLSFVRKIGQYGFFLLCVVFCISTSMTVRSYVYSYRGYHVSIESLFEQKAAGKSDIILPRLKYKRDKRQYKKGIGLTDDPEYWVNKHFASYYKINTVALEKRTANKDESKGKGKN